VKKRRYTLAHLPLGTPSKTMSQYGIQHTEGAAVIKARLVVMHLACLGVFFVPATLELVVAAVLAYFLRVFAWEGGSHRYFAHRSFKTSRVFQFILGALAAAAGQRGPLWWAHIHRLHHRHSDSEKDLHSPVRSSFWHAHVGWLFDRSTLDTDLDAVKDFARYPELVWLNKYHYIFAVLALVLTYVVGEYTSLFGRERLGVSSVVWVFFLSTALSLHASFAVNTLTHGMSVNWFNRRPFKTKDTTTNSVLLAIPTMGAGWHNNHHRYMNSARAGFYWWELDLTYLTLRLLAVFRIVWDLHPVPAAVLAEGRDNPAA
jgi:stearoyl-CoA desaturase (Delta-9 desaturase)